MNNKYIQHDTFFQSAYYCTDKPQESLSNDLVKGRYHTIHTVWFSDTTQLGNFWLMAIMDSVTRRVVAYRLKRSTSKNRKDPFNSNDFIGLVNESILHDNAPDIIHTDQAGFFTSKKTKQFLKSTGIQQSTTDKEILRFGNQMIERLWRTLKHKIECILQENPKQVDFTSAVDEAIQEYHDTQHSALIGLTPNTMQDALVTLPQHKQIQLSDIVAASGTDLYAQQKDIKAIVVQQYASNWIQFFLDLKQSIQQHVEEQADRIIQAQKQESERIIDAQAKQIQQLQHQIKDMAGAIEYLKQQEILKAAEKKAKEDARQRRRNRISLPARDAARLSELEIALECIKRQNENSSKATPFTAARDSVAILLLYVFGIRIGNLRLINAGHLHQILDENKVDLQLIKSRTKTVQTFLIPSIALSILDEYREAFQILIDGKEAEAPVFTQQGSSKPRGRTYLTYKINAIRKQVSKTTKKNIRAHSFRIGRTTALIEAVGIDVASKIIGHKDIRTTEVYNRRVLNEKEISDAFNKALASQQKDAEIRKQNTLLQRTRRKQKKQQPEKQG